MKTMKTIYSITRNKLVLFTFLAGLQASALVAAGNVHPAEASRDKAASVITAIAPLTPAEATFEDGTDARESVMTFQALAPIVPAVADFGDEMQAEINLEKLAPVTPAEAEFEELQA